MTGRRGAHGAATQVLSGLMIAIGVAMVAITVASGGGPLARGVLLGALFVAAGALRLWLERARER